MMEKEALELKDVIEKLNYDIQEFLGENRRLSGKLEDSHSENADLLTKIEKANYDSRGMSA
jgi:hypothetical protein